MLRILKSEIARLGREESGVALVLTLSVFLLLFVLCAGAYSIGETVRQKVEIQNACDSAAYSAALVQADGLSRMAMVNRALSWTYVQMTNMQIDYITYRWLELVARRFDEDYRMCEQYNANTRYRWPLGWSGNCPCGEGQLKTPGVGWFCGVAGEGMRMVRLNNHSKPVSVDGINETVQKCSGIANYAGYIRDMKDQIENFNQAQRAIALKMHQSMAQTVSAVLVANLPRNEAGDVDKQLASDFLFYQAVPFPMTEDASSPYDNESLDSETGLPVGLGYFSPLLNTERDERIFLTMADGKVFDTLHEYFGTSGSDERIAGGLDQWFIRTCADEFPRDEPYFFTKLPNASAETTRRTYMDFGICRAYKNANRISEGRLPSYRDHHRSLTSDTAPSCLNTHDICPEQCHAIPNSVGLVADYEWVSGQYKYGCYHFKAYRINTHIHYLSSSFLEQCEGGHQCQFPGTSHRRSEYKSCTASSKRLMTIEPFTGKELIPYPLIPYYEGTVDTWWLLTDATAQMSVTIKPNGFARIYGDDVELKTQDENLVWQYLKGKYSEDELKGYEGSYVGSYVGTPAKPWVLNSTFYGKDGAIIVGLARRQRNPWVSLLNSISDVLSSDKTDADGIYSAFNPVANGYIVAFSAARAAHRFHSSPYAQKWVAKHLGHPDVPPLGDMEDGEYETRYDAVCDDVKRNDSGGEKEWRFNIQCGDSGLKELRVGCVCNDMQNGSRFARCWNLCETDWDATLLPLRYAWAEPSGEWYDGYANDLNEGHIGGVYWETVGRDGMYDMDPLEYAATVSESWARLFDSSGNPVKVGENGEIPAAFRPIRDDFMCMTAPLDCFIEHTGSRTVQAPYGSFDVEDVRKREGDGKSDPRLDMSNLYKTRVL